MFGFGLTDEYLNERCYGMEEETVSYIPDFNKDIEAVDIVAKYVYGHLDKSDPIPDYSVYIVWKSKILRNWKYLISTSLFDGMYYELTFNGDTAEWYLDAYKKFENMVIPTEHTEWMKHRGIGVNKDCPC
jgi:hypothetical protein